MKGYALVKEHDTHFELSHPRDGVFKVAKRPLDEATLRRIRKLPQAMADGGEVEDPEDTTVDPVTPLAGNQPLDAMPAPTGLATLLNQDYKPSETYDRNATIAPSQSATAPGAAGDLEKLKSKLLVDQQRPPIDANPNTQAPNLAGGTQAAQSAQGSVPGPLTAADFSKPLGQEEAGINGVAAAQKQGGDASAKVYDQLSQQLAATQKDYETKTQALDAENKNLQADIASTKIDPHRVWNGTSTGNKVIAAIGVALSGIGSGLTGQQNLALKVINDTVDRDIDAQKADLGKKQNLLSANLQKYGRLDQAVAATRANLLSVAQGQAAGIAAKTQGSVAQANAQQLLGQLGMQTQQLVHQVGMQSVLGRIQSGQMEIGPQDIPRLPQEMQKKAVMLPGGKVRFGLTDDDAKAVKDVQEAAGNVQGTVREMQTLMQGGTAWTPARRAQAEALYNRIIPQVNELAGLKRLSDKDIEVIKGQVPNPGAFMQGSATAKLDVLNQTINNKVGSVYANRLINYNPAQAASTDRKVK